MTFPYRSLFFIFLLFSFTLFASSAAAWNPSIPGYFVAIHNEPSPPDSPETETNFIILTGMVEQADLYNIKLTLMFTAQWAEYITASADRIALVKSWQDNGHEIAAHHHSIYHQIWDGYTNYAQELAADVRSGYQLFTPYLGTLTTYILELQKLTPVIQAGCVNDEYDKHAMPDEIIYDTCSGFANFGNPGQEISDTDPRKGMNEFISVGYYKDIQRKWLTHYQTTTMDKQLAAQNVFLSMQSGVYGSVNHSHAGEQEAFLAYLDFLHAQDPSAENSCTVSSVMESNLLPSVDLDLVFSPVYPCGDQICGPFEQENPQICPADCSEVSFPWSLFLASILSTQH